jgi:hypothetical protein
MECPHEGCTCQVASSDEFCSDHCRTHEDHSDVMACECGHPECAGSAMTM